MIMMTRSLTKNRKQWKELWSYQNVFYEISIILEEEEDLRNELRHVYARQPLRFAGGEDLVCSLRW
jgi:hypothetical protein